MRRPLSGRLALGAARVAVGVVPVMRGLPPTQTEPRIRFVPSVSPHSRSVRTLFDDWLGPLVRPGASVPDLLRASCAGGRSLK